MTAPTATTPAARPSPAAGLIRVIDAVNEAVGRALAAGLVVMALLQLMLVEPERCGNYLAPTVVRDVHPGMEIACEEVFGPVLSVLTFDDADEAVRQVQATDFGLSAGVWSRDIDTCMGVARAVRTGTVWVNTFMDGFPELPFGGYKQSGIGRELGRNAVEDFTETKTVQIHRGERTNWWARPRGTQGA